MSNATTATAISIPVVDGTGPLAGIPLFTALSPAQLHLVTKSMRPLRLHAQEILFDAQQEADRFFLLRRGQIKLFRLSANGDEKIIELVRPGMVFAVAVMFMERKTYPVAAEAVQDCELLSFDNRLFLSILRESSETCFRMMGHMSLRLRCQVGEIDSLCLQSASGRLANYLLDLLPDDDLTSCTVVLDASKRLIASRLSIQPETLSRLLAKMVRLGLIRVNERSVDILDVEQLRRYILENP
ncbi:MAG: Crp/Fnr family transcriptional regulator [Magnetococcales bacterium]|nr:Crp/Fnr family transcriptional regulator [Magnetococcales bacterium]